jgi:hypothetical protein
MVGGCYIIIHGGVGELLKEDLYSAEGRQSINPSMNSVLKFSTLEITWQVDHTDPYHTALLRFNNLWAAEYAHNSLLVFSTGRSPHKYEELHQQVPLLTPSIGIFSVGTEILYGSSLEPDQGWVSLLDDGWDRDVALKELQRFTNLRMQVCIFKCMCIYIHIYTHDKPDAVLRERINGWLQGLSFVVIGGKIWNCCLVIGCCLFCEL